jgi:hypothetical protein
MVGVQMRPKRQWMTVRGKKRLRAEMYFASYKSECEVRAAAVANTLAAGSKSAALHTAAGMNRLCQYTPCPRYHGVMPAQSFLVIRFAAFQQSAGLPHCKGSTGGSKRPMLSPILQQLVQIV